MRLCTTTHEHPYTGSRYAEARRKPIWRGIKYYTYSILMRDTHS